MHTTGMEQGNRTNLMQKSDNGEVQVYAALIRMLASREQSHAELSRKLLEKGFAVEAVANQLTQARQTNIQSDRRFAEMSMRVAFSKGHGPNRLRQKMQQHEIDNAIVIALIDSEEYDWYDLAYSVKTRKFGESIESDWQRRQKQQRFLLGRGFTFEQINFAVSHNPALGA